MAKLSKQTEALTEVAELLQKKQQLEFKNPAITYFPNNGPLRKELYPKHMEFCRLTKQYKDCAIIAGNRLGKTVLVQLIVTQWVTGQYYKWFEGFRFDRPVKVMCLCDSNQNLRDVWSKVMLGRSLGQGKYEGGFISPDRILEVVTRNNTGGLVDYALVKSDAGEHSTIYFRSYEQDRTSFQGYTLDAIIFDEEPHPAVHGELVTRVMTTGGKLIYSFTPLKGMSEVAMTLLNEEKLAEKDRRIGIVHASMYDVPHITPDMIEASKRVWPRMEWDARIYGKISTGQGMFYPIPDDEIGVKRFYVPDNWPRFMGFDYGFRRTAAVYLAVDPQTKIVYLYDLIVMKDSTPADHYMAMRMKGSLWIPGASETALTMDSGQSRLEYYQELGLNLYPAKEAKKNLLASIDVVYQYLVSGQLKVFSDLTQWFAEKATYHLTEKMKVTDLPHDLMDATRYAIVDGIEYADVNPDYADASLNEHRFTTTNDKNPVTGY